MTTKTSPAAVATVCRAEGHEVAVANDAAGAEARFAERLPDAVILDVMFPENPSGGFELARIHPQDGARSRS